MFARRLLGRKSPQAKRQFSSSLTKRWTLAGAVLTGAVATTFFYHSVSAADNTSEEVPKKKRVVVLGSGWATLGLIKKIGPRMWEGDDIEVIIVSPRNYFLFTPLLPGCTTGSLEVRSIVTPIRVLLAGKKYTNQFYEATCVSIDPEKNEITCQDFSDVKGPQENFTLKYDYLVVAVGSQPATFGTKGVREHAFFLKSPDDAMAIRNRILDCFETANFPGLSDAERKKLLSFVIVGGGPTGCEFAGELSDFLEQDVTHYFPHLKKDVSVSLIQSGNVILNSFDEKIAQSAQDSMSKRDNLKIHTNKRVLSVSPDAVMVCDKTTKEEFEMPFSLCVWSTGVIPVPIIGHLAKKIPAQTNRAGLLTDTHMKVVGTDNIYAIGDCAIIEQKKIAATMNELFQKADKDGNGNLSYCEFKQWLDEVKAEFPQMAPQAKNLKNVFKSADLDGSGSLDAKEFETVLLLADSCLRNLPTTAQVANQEGSYLGKELKLVVRGKEGKPFQYHQIAQFAYLGKDSAIGELPHFKGSGFLVYMMWKGVYLGYQQTWSNVATVLFYWFRKTLFGRDISRQ